jgi:hypothetical protein
MHPANSPRPGRIDDLHPVPAWGDAQSLGRITGLHISDNVIQHRARAITDVNLLGIVNGNKYFCRARRRFLCQDLGPDRSAQDDR